MANTNDDEKYAIEKKGNKIRDADKSQGNIISSKIKVQLSKHSREVIPSDSNKSTASFHTTSEKKAVENNNILTVADKQNSQEISGESTGNVEQRKADCQVCGVAEEKPKEHDVAPTESRLRAQRRWRMGLLKRSKLGDIGQDVTGLFPDYFPSTTTTQKESEEDDILTSLKESKQQHRAKLLKQNSIDKIDRELGDRETKLIAGSWLQIYS